ncbi:hypothetical protein BB559_003227 [Furculomyces boomerangus]|uniref:LYR motif-containing protein Cup1-like N-terminal domain-containing protein n=1 Tax=Furculomyces boomerangus TaxID=61424 RepID=A0A2T9YMT3_9FUNG|nr:hypothetical protein BB559_003227 [Furculomyces boomerangus]
MQNQNYEQSTQPLLTNDAQHQFNWVLATDGQIPMNAVQGGIERDGKPLFIAKGVYKNGLHPGKAGPHLKQGFCLSYGGKEVLLRQYYVLCGDSSKLRWVEQDGLLNIQSFHPVEAGYEESGEPLFVAKTTFQGSQQLGKIGQHLKLGMNFPYDGKEKFAKKNISRSRLDTDFNYGEMKRTNTRSTKSFKLGNRQYLGNLKDANDGKLAQILKVLRLGYGRTGKLKYKILFDQTEFVHGEKLPTDISELKSSHPVLYALLKNQFGSDVIKVKVPTHRTFLKRNVKNIQQKNYEKLINNLNPHLPLPLIKVLEARAKFGLINDLYIPKTTASKMNIPDKDRFDKLVQFSFPSTKETIDINSLMLNNIDSNENDSTLNPISYKFLPKTLDFLKTYFDIDADKSDGFHQSLVGHNDPPIYGINKSTERFQKKYVKMPKNRTVRRAYMYILNSCPFILFYNTLPNNTKVYSLKKSITEFEALPKGINDSPENKGIMVCYSIWRLHQRPVKASIIDQGKEYLNAKK